MSSGTTKTMDNERTRVLLVDDHVIFREGLRAVLERESGIEVVGEASTGEEALELVGRLKPDIVVMDIKMPGGTLSGIVATHLICEREAVVKVIILSMFSDEEEIEQAIQAGANGYVVKQSASRELLTAIPEVLAGNAFFSPSIAKIVLDRHRYMSEGVPNRNLTLREKEVLQMVAQGKSNKEIGEQLKLSHKTIAKYREHIMEKLELHDSISLTRYAIEKGIVK